MNASVAVGDHSRGAVGRSLYWSSKERFLLVGLVSVTALNLLVLVIQAPALIHNLYLNSDNASALVLPALANHLPAGSIVNLGDHPWYEPWWFMRATAGLSDYRALWEAFPFAVAFLGIASISACAGWVLGRLAGLLTASVLLATSDAMRSVFYTPETRVVMVLHVGILCGALLFVHSRYRAGQLTRRALLAVGIPLVAFTGAGLTDQLVVVTGLVPFVLAPLLCWWRYGPSEWRRLAIFALVISAASLLLAAVLARLMEEQHIIHAPFPIDFLASSAIFTNGENLIAALVSLGGGSFFGGPVSGANLITFIAGALTLAALAATLRVVWRWASSPGNPTVLHADRKMVSSRAAARELFTAYWGTTLVAVLGIFIITSVSENAADGRYLVGAWIAMAALLGVYATKPGRRIVTVLSVCLFCAIALYTHLTTGVPAYGHAPDQRTAGMIEHFVVANHATVGYAGYWDSAPLTWQTDLRVRAYPIMPCSAMSGWCRFYNNNISSWYVPRASARSFLVVDSRRLDPLEVEAPPVAFGSPLTQESIGPLTVYIYGHDLAADLGG